MKRTFLLILLLILSAAAFAQVNTVVTDLNNTIVITLESNPTTGYHWELAKPLDTKRLELISSDYIPPVYKRFGAYGQETWTFKPKQYGKTSISLKYVRPWEKDIPPIKTKEFQVQIVKDTSSEKKVETFQELTTDEAASLIAPLARDVMLSLKGEDMDSLAGFVDPKAGVRFSPYALVDTKKDTVVQANKLASLFKSSKKYFWGYYQDNGEKIYLTFKDYYKEFIWDRDYTLSGQISFGGPIGVSNTLNNSKQVYPRAVIVEYYLPGLNPKYSGMDWKCLRLVFNRRGERWYLIGIIHDAWMI